MSILIFKFILQFYIQYDTINKAINTEDSNGYNLNNVTEEFFLKNIFLFCPRFSLLVTNRGFY
ncbi:Hypothetical protein MYEA_3020 [Mycoplasma yeatsii 13926]|uniref:Uncharacterized protein n=1 Tax=Mycoplasma yeatsii 13926 TaxID=1188240 RepID=S6G6Y6_9MOLU|nr:Hypothetical protein MYEA_3020 [Mycoplasma yeatsii 13926]